MANLFEEYKKHKEGSDSTEPSSTSSLYEKYKNRNKVASEVPEVDFATDYLSKATDSDMLAKYASVMQNADFAENSQYKGGSGFHLTNQVAHGAYENLNSGNNKDPRNLSWTPNEKAVFNYLYNTEDYKTATQLLLDLTKDSNVRYNEIEKAETQKRIDNYGNLVGESALSIPQSVVGGLGQIAGGLSMGLTSALQGEGFSKGWTEAAEMNRLSNAANAVRESSTEKIAQDSGNKVAPFFYQTGMSVGDSLFSALISGGVGELGALLALGGSASQQKTMEVLNNGGTAQEAAMSGITSGVIEGLTEKVSLGHLTKILKGNAVKGGFKELAKTLAKNMLEEAGEEATSELTNALTDAIILDWTNNVGTESDLKKFYDEQIANGYSESEATENTIWELTKNTLVSAAGGALGALMSGGVTTGIRTASDYRAGKTTNEYGRTQDIADLARKEGREDIAQMIEKNPSNLNVGYGQDALAEEAIETLRDKKASAEDKIKSLDRMGELKEKLNPITGIADKKGKMLHPTAIKWEEGSPVFVTEEGTYKAADVTVTNSASKLINLTEDIPEQARQTFIENYNGENLGDYVKKFEQAYELAKADWQDDLTKMVTDGLLTETQMKNIYKAAQKDVTSESYQLENLKKNIEEKKRLFPDKKIRVKIDTSAVDLTKLNANQRHNVTLAEALAKALGFNLTLFDSTKEQGQRKNINGSYEESTNTISLDINATNSGTHNKGTTNAIITTLSHEITHWSKTNAPGIYKAFRDTTLKTLNENSGQNFSTIGAYVDVNKVAYPGLSDAEVADELVARACENMLQNSEFAKEALGRMTAEEQKTLGEKIIEFFNKIREAIKEIMGRSDSNSLEYRMLKKDSDRLAELQKMWDNLIREASSNAAWATEQIEDAEKTSFSLKDPVEKVGDLVAVHNLHEDDFIKTLKLGGFPMPSIAIMKAENAGQNSQYGEISVVFDAETVNPKKGGNVYGLDVWTSTYPKVEYKLNKKKASELFQKAKSWKKPGVKAFDSNKLYSEEVERRLNNEGGVEGFIERLMDDTDLMNTFLAQSGKQVDEYVQKQYKRSLTDSEVKHAEYVLNTIPQIKDMTGPELLQYVRENRARVAKIVAESFEDPDVLPEDFSGIEIKAILDTAKRYSVSGRELVRNEVDLSATDNLIKSRVDMAQYKAWLEELFDGIVEKRGLYNGKSRYTESGKERPWDSLHYEETLENVVKVMKLHKNGESFFNVGLLWAAGAKKYKSIEEIKRDANRLKELPEEEYSKLKEELGMRMSRIASDLQKHRSSSGNSLIDHDDAMRSILELFMDYNGDVGRIENALKNEYAYKGDIREIVEETAQLLKEVGNMPTGYFEAKPQKAIPFSNVVAAIIPSNASEELTDLLNQNSIPTELYAPGNNEDRLAKLNGLKGAKFSVKEDSEGNVLSEGQADYFADSEIRDKKGNLILVYHGTPSGGFTVFRNGLTYFTANRKYAERYTRTSGSGRTGDASQIYSGYINITKPFTLDDKEAKRIYIEEFIKGGYAQGMNPYAPDSEIRKYASDGIDWNEADNLKDFFDEMGYDYDGIILNEGGDITENGTVMRGDSYVTFNQNQFKDKNNLNPTKDKDIRYSQKEDSEGKELSQDQIDFFARSQIRDDNGKLIPMYHGTDAYKEFTVFKPGKSGYLGKGMYFSASRNYAKRYAEENGYEGRIYEVYLNVVNPLVVTSDNPAKEILGEKIAAKRALKNSFSTQWLTSADIKKLQDKGYDGIVWKYGSSPLEVSIWNPSQIKRVDNLHPTENPDIRYSRKEDSEGKELSKDQVEFFKNSMVRTADGRLKVMYHGARGAGFTVFNQEMTDDGLSFFFTDKLHIAKGYTGSKEVFSPDKEMTFEELKQLAENYLNGEWYIEKDGNSVVVKEVGSIGEEDSTLFEGKLKDAQKFVVDRLNEGSGVDANYKAYLNLVNPLVVNAEGNQWDELPLLEGMESDSGFATTRDYSRYAFENGYDGVIFNNIYDVGLYSTTSEAETSTVAVAFSSEQIKSVDNLHPTKNPDIRFSKKDNENNAIVNDNDKVFSYKDNEGYLHLDADDVLSMDDFEDYLNRVIGRNKRIEAHLRRLNVKIKDNVILNQTKLHEFAKIIKDRYGLTGTFKSIEEELSKAYMKVTDIEGFNKAAESIAEKLIEESRHQDIDPAMIREVEALKKELKGYKIALNDVQKQELANTYGSNWSSHLLGKVRLASDGIKLDELWDTLVSEHPDYFSTITYADEGANLAALLDRLYSGDYNGVRWTKEMTKERTEWLINDIREASWRISDNLTMAEKYDEAMKELRERLKNAKEEVREEAQRKRLIQKIVEREDRLITMLRKNDKENHIPDVLKAPLKALLDLVDVQAYVTTEAMANNFNALANALQNVSADYADPEAMDNALKDLTLYFDSNGYFVQNVKDIAAEVQAKVGNALGTTKHNSSILDLSTDSLKKLNEALVAISHAAWNYDKVLAEDTTQRISTRSESTMTFLGQFDNRKAMSDVLKRAISFLAWDNTTPIYGYDRFGEGGRETFRGIMKGDDQLTLNSKVIIDFTKSVFTGQEAEDWSKEIHDLGIGDYKITTAQIMSLYCLNKRQAAKQHLYAARDLYGKRLEGAVKNVYGEVMDGKGIVIGETKGIEKSKAIQVTKADVERITSMLTDRQKEVADKLQEFMGTVCADWGNYVTMRRFGIMQFGEDNYFPMQVFLENRESHPKETVQQASIFKLLNMGFTKSLNERGNGALELNSIFDVFIRHSSEMAAYNAFALPILDAYKWLSYKEEGTDGIKSLKTASRLAYGNDGINFIMNHLEDLNGTSNTATSAEQIVKNVIRRYKTAATAANMRVVLMQPTSYLRAVNEIDSKYLRRAINLNPKALKATINEMNEKSPLAMKKNGLGAFDVNISRTVAEQALQTENVKSAKGVFEKAMNVSMIFASKADEITWATLYKAVQLETKEKHPELQGDAFDSYVNDRFRDICYRTQVFDSINARSNLMRKKDLFHQMLTAFGSEPTLSYSMLSNNVFLYAVEARNGQYQRAWNKYGKKIKHAFVAFMLSAIAVSAVAAVPDWLRDDEDDKNFIETYFKNFGMNILGEATGLLPYIRDIYSVFIEGYDPSRPDEEIFKTARQAGSALTKAIEDGQITYRTVYQAAKLFSQSTGLPIGNLVRDFKSLWNKTVGEVFGMKIK